MHSLVFYLEKDLDNMPRHYEDDFENTEFGLIADYWDELFDDDDITETIDILKNEDSDYYDVAEDENGNKFIMIGEEQRKDFRGDTYLRVMKLLEQCRWGTSESEYLENGKFHFDSWCLKDEIDGDNTGIYIVEEYYQYPVPLHKWLNTADLNKKYYIGSVFDYHY